MGDPPKVVTNPSTNVELACIDNVAILLLFTLLLFDSSSNSGMKITTNERQLTTILLTVSVITDCFDLFGLPAALLGGGGTAATTFAWPAPDIGRLNRLGG